MWRFRWMMWSRWGCLELNFVTSDGDWRLEMLRKSSLWFEGFVFVVFGLDDLKSSNTSEFIRQDFPTWLSRCKSLAEGSMAGLWIQEAMQLGCWDIFQKMERCLSHSDFARQQDRCQEDLARSWDGENRDDSTGMQTQIMPFFFRLKRTFWSWKHVVLVSISWLLFGIWN